MNTAQIQAVAQQLQGSFQHIGNLTDEQQTELYAKWQEWIQQLNAVNALPGWAEFKKEKSLFAKTQGNDCFTKGNNKDAVVWFTLAILLDPTDAVFYSNRSAAYTNLGRYHEALEDVNRGLALKPDWGKLYSRKGAALFGLRRFDDAKTAYLKALALEPQNAVIKQALEQVELKVKFLDAIEKGEEMIAKNKIPEAISYFSKAVELDPQDSLGYISRAEAYLHSGTADHLNKALADTQKTIALRQDWPKGYIKHGEVLGRLGRWDEAASVYSFALKFDPNNEKVKSQLNYAVQEGTRFRIRDKMQQQAQQQAQQDKGEKK